MAQKSNNDHDRYCLQYQFDAEKIQCPLLQGGRVCDHFTPHGFVVDPFDLYRVLGNGGEIREQGAEAVNGQGIVGQFGSCFPLGGFGALAGATMLGRLLASSARS